jgi:hypothetical protein
MNRRLKPIQLEGISVRDFYAYMPMHNCIFAPTGEMWPRSSVDARLPKMQDDEDPKKPLAPSIWLDKHQPVEQMTWCPGLPQLIRGRLISDGGWIERTGCTCFNLYRPPQIELGDASMVGPWLDHIDRIYPDDRTHIVSWSAHRVQRPQEKVNHALVLGGAQGIGKDTLLEPLKAAVGPWNFCEISPVHLLGRFNGFVKSVVLRISEARDLGDVDRYSFYERLKIFAAAPPDVIRVDEKNLREYAAWNVCGVVITTNHKTSGLYLPADDRRHYVAWSNRTNLDFPPGYWTRLHEWYAAGGTQHVAAFLAECDLSEFDPKAPPPKTSAFWEMVDANRSPEDAELADALDQLGRPSAVTLIDIASRASAEFGEWLRDRRNTRHASSRLEAAGYVHIRNADAQDGLWRVDGRRQVIYVRHELSSRDRSIAARERVDR